MSAIKLQALSTVTDGALDRLPALGVWTLGRAAGPIPCEIKTQVCRCQAERDGNSEPQITDISSIRALMHDKTKDVQLLGFLSLILLAKCEISQSHILSDFFVPAMFKDEGTRVSRTQRYIKT